MARFLYEHPKTGEFIDQFFPCGKAPRRIVLDDGTVCQRALGAEIAGRGRANLAGWPMTSHALAVHPSQRKQYQEFSEKHGVRTEFDKDGKPVFESRSHRRKYAELVGAVDLDGGYGDPSGGRHA